MAIQQTKSWATAFSIPAEGVQRGIQRMDELSQRIAEGDVSGENFAEQSEAEAAVKANIQSMRTSDSLVGTLLNEKA